MIVRDSRWIGLIAGIFMLLFIADGYAFFGGKFKTLKPENGKLMIPIKDIDDGQAHYFKAKSKNGIMVSFFTVKSPDGVIRAAIDACDVCYRSGKGYVQQGDVMVCTNCGRKFATGRINEVKGGCNPAPLNRVVDSGKLVVDMADINANAWYCEYKRD
ncbi:MAG: DUF2318 domain-containing protein [Desulfobacteraceae bacterium]|nr:MAG: DUF2318 domain-containing protein [Desulfobacteraceae bacterium]